MKLNRMLTAGFLALVCAGTAAASQLKSVQFAPKGNAATVILQTSGSFAHKEYRPDEHLLLVDLTGVSSDAALVHTVAVKSAMLKSYAVSNYTNAAGTVVTRVEFALGDKVSANVVDAADGLQIHIQPGQSASAAAPKPAAPAAASALKSAQAAAPKPASSAIAKATAVSAPTIAPPAVAPAPAVAAKPATLPNAAKPAAQKAHVELTTIRSISVQQQPDSLDVVIEGPSSAQPVRMNNPERLVLDFANSVMQPSVKSMLPLHTPDVLRVRVGRGTATNRIVIDLRGPRAFEVLPSAERVVVRIKADPAAAAAAALSKPAVKPRAARVQPVSMLLPAVAPVSPKQPEAPALNAPAAKAAEPVAAVASVPAVKATEPVAPVASIPPPVARPAPVSQPLAAPAVAPQPEKPPVPMARLVSPEIPDSISTGSASRTATKPKYTGEPISVNLKDVDLKDFFRLIHEISGLNVVLDPSVHGAVTLVLDDVPWDQALDIVLKNNALDRELQGNVLRIAASDTLRREAVDRRAQAEAIALAVDRQTVTRTLSYAKAGQVVPTLKKFMTARGDVIADDRTNSLIISDIPSVLPTLDHLISQLDKKTQEVEIEMRVVSASRNFSRDLGFQLGFAWGNGVSTVSGVNQVGTASVTNPVAGRSTSIPLFSNFPAAGATTGLGFSNITSSYAIDAILTAAETHSLAKVLSRPRVVTQSNMKAEIKQGVQIPVYTSGTANANSSVTYTDAVLRLSVLPQVTADNTIFLTVNVENTQPDGQLNGNFILSTQQASTQVLVTDGGTVVIGGVIQTSNRVSVNQTPVLGDIPWLGNLFKERSVSTDTEELIFFITPKIIQS